MSTLGARSGYSRTTKALHWLTVAALTAQFAVGYVMDADDGGRGRGRGRSGDSGRGRGRGGDGEGYLDDPDTLLKIHIALGGTILALAAVRFLWRRLDGLPPWAEQLSPGQRRLAHWTERVLLTTVFVIPLTGLALVLGGDDDLVWIHVAAHVAFFAALAAHVGLVVSRGLMGRML